MTLLCIERYSSLDGEIQSYLKEIISDFQIF